MLSLTIAAQKKKTKAKEQANGVSRKWRNRGIFHSSIWQTPYMFIVI